MSSTALRIGIAGLGTVGAALAGLLREHGDLVSRRAGRPIQITAISARDRGKDRGVDLSLYAWEDDPLAIASRDDVDLVVELIGGADGVAKQLVETALENGKHVVTANKALLARHGIALAGLAEAHGRALNFEAAVAGGIPIIKSLREGFAGNRIHALYGILNGTSNYILSEMRESGGAFADVLKDAQEKGYAEADPSFDIDGIDAAHKLSILSGLAFGVVPDFGAVSVAGIRSVSADDIMFAEELGYRIKLLGIARGAGEGRIEQSIEPCLISEETPLASVEGVYNAVFAAGDFVGSAMLEGRGAGGGPTASAVAADIVDIARGLVLPAYGVPVAALEQARWAGDEEIECAYYLRLRVTDRPGVVADISAILRDYAISIETMIQTARDPGQPVSLVMTLHECARASMAAAAEKIERLECVAEKPVMLRIERF